ncbi:MAG: CPBP family intramembrane metalloprotease [Lachnospiraceae bacterium]|nr:CPBP family intramembrane metalloprotease [Lachnospiraceae bacterium]
MNTKIIQTLVKKEMLDVLRDKKTVVMMLVVPVILYPLIFIGAMQVMAMVSSGMATQNYRIAIEAEDNGAFLHKLTENDDKWRDKGSRTEVDTEDKSDDNDNGNAYTITIVDAASIDDYEAALEAEELDVYIRGTMQDGKPNYDVYYISSVTNSAYAMNIVMDVFDEYLEELTQAKIKDAGLDIHEILEPVLYKNKDTASSEQSLGSIMGSVLPFMLIISLLMGTMYPAIDTTAGERERGTLETILTLPVTNRQLIVSKFITVAVIGMISALLNIISMGGIAFYMYKIMDMQTDTAGFDMAKFYPAILVGILAIFAFSLFISAVTMCVTSFAKSYKEANNYITPLTLVVMFTGYIGFIPNIELTQTMAMIPVANICLLIKNILIFKIDYAIIAVVLISNIAYAVFAILFLSKIYDSESILFNDGKGGLQLFEKRENLKKGGVPAVSDVWFVVALTIVLVLYAGSMLQLKFGLWGVFGTQLILLLVPLAVVLYTKKDICLTYGFHKTGIRSFLGAFFVILGMYPINIVLSLILVSLFPQSAENVELTFSTIMDGNAFSVLFVIALAPAICEEMLFRGLIYNSMKARYRVSTAIAIVAVLFGIYHMSLVKFIPTGLLGLVLCYVAYKSGSIYPSMMMHFINNAVSVAVSLYPERIEKMFPVLYKESASGLEVVLLVVVGCIFMGIGCVLLFRKEMDQY